MINLLVKRGLILLLLILPFVTEAQDINVMLKEAERLEQLFKEPEALQKYKEVLRLQPTNLTALCRCSDLCSRIGHRQTDKNRKADYFKAARTYAEVALTVDPRSPEANFLMAVAMGRTAMMVGGKEKIRCVTEIKRYAENTLKYDPNNSKAYHVLGKWHYEVSNLNSVERAAAKVFYGGLPQASLKDAIRYYEKSKSLDPSFIINYLELAKAYHRDGQDKKALELLTRLQAMPEKIQDDKRIKQEGKTLMKELTD